jgi:hypothetical protein
MSKMWNARKIPAYHDGMLCSYEQFNGRPVFIVEVIDETGDTITFQTDYPVETITIPRGEFYSKFIERGR